MQTIKSIFCKVINWQHFVLVSSLLLCGWNLVVMIHYSGASFWGDELATILVAGSNLSLLETIKINITGEVYGGLVFYPLANIWMKLVPYGTKWALLLNELFVCAGILFLGQIAQKVRGKLAGIISVIFACVCSYLTLQGAYEFRCYGVNFFCSMFALWAFLRKNDDAKAGCLVLFSVSAILLTFSHFTSAFFLFSLFLADVYSFLKKRNTIRHIVPYFIWGAFFLPYVIYAYLNITGRVDDYWTPRPNPLEIFTFASRMLDNPLLCVFYYCSAAWLIFRLLRSLIIKQSVFSDGCSGAYLILWTVLAFTLCNFTYSFINYNYSMWGMRYFFSIMGSLILVCGIGVSDLLERMFSTKLKLCWKAAVSIIFVFSFVWLELCYISDLKANRFPEVLSQPFEQAAEFLREQDNFWDDDTAIYCSAFNIEAWQYYLAHGDMTPGLLHYLPLNIESVDLSEYKTIFVTEIQNPVPQSTWDYLAQTHVSEEIHHDYKIYRYTRK